MEYKGWGHADIRDGGFQNLVGSVKSTKCGLVVNE
jgi:hypothetical protein